jgi:hypothetical protein
MQIHHGKIAWMRHQCDYRVLRLSPRPFITILRYGLPRSDYARTLSNPVRTAMLINKQRFSKTL